MRLRREFRARGPWVTEFRWGNQRLGGTYASHSDPRVANFLRAAPQPGRVLELGCLEGGHTLPIARQARHVVAIDARADNLSRARWIQRLYGQWNITFLQADLEEFDLVWLGAFDQVFNVGLLYHLARPWDLLARLARISSEMFLWTHVAPRDRAVEFRSGYAGTLYREQGLADPLSGMAELSFWPTKGALMRMLAQAGFDDCRLVDEAPSHPHGPAVSLWCRSSIPCHIS